MTREQLIFDKGYNAVENNFSPKMDIESVDFNSILPKSLQRNEDINLPDVPEFEIVRHYVNLAHKNYGVDSGIYPLGSCTMKYNPRINEVTARLPGFLKIHPLQEENEGAIELIYNLGQQLCEICGMDAFTLNPAAGAQGELVGIFLMKKYFESKGITSTLDVFPDRKSDYILKSLLDLPWNEIRSDNDFPIPTYHRGLEIPEYDSKFVKHLTKERYVKTNFF